MKDKFPLVYKDKIEDFNSFLSQSIIILDANVLLDLYKYSTRTRNKIVSTLKKYKDNLWLPNQFALEYHRNRINTLYIIEDGFISTVSFLNGLSKDLLDKFTDKSKEYKQIKYLKSDDIISDIKKSFKEIIKKINASKKKCPKFHEDDIILKEITELFAGMVGNPYSDEQLKTIYENGKIRYDLEIPPGYKDIDKDKKDKTKTKKYGDYVAWLQILDKGESDKKDIVIITRDQKEDWWQVVRGRTIGPRQELIEELYKKTEKTLHMYSMESFMKCLDDDGGIDKMILTEIQNIATEDENLINELESSKQLTNDEIVGDANINSDVTLLSNE